MAYCRYHKTNGFMITTGDLADPTGHFGQFATVQQAHKYLLEHGWVPDYPNKEPNLNQLYTHADGRRARIDPKPSISKINHL